MNRRERLMLMVSIVLLGGIIFKFLIHDPQQAQYETLVSARDAAAAELAKDEMIVARAQQARDEYERVRAHIAAVEQRLPQRKEIPALLTAMEQYTKQVGVTLDTIRPGSLTPVAAAAAAPAPATAGTQAPAAAGPGSTAGAGPGQTHAPRAAVYSSMPIDLTLSGTFSQVVEYLRGLRGFPRLVIVDSVSLTPQGAPKLAVTIHSEIYTLGAPPGQTGGTH
jgi:Tfp pilus assembly protein PilO